MSPTRALVLGGGGVAGIAWEIGVLTGLADAGLDLTGADLLVGTSAGATVAAQISSAVPLAALFDRQLVPAAASGEMAVAGRPEEIAAVVVQALDEGLGPSALRRRIGRFACDATTPDEAVRRRVVAGRLPLPDWPERPVLLVAADAETGDLAVFDRHCGVELVDAVAASSAVPGVWPPVTLDGRRYMDGGVRSLLNLDLAAGADVVLALAPLPDDMAGLDAEVTAARGRVEAASAVRVLGPDRRAADVLAGNVLDPAIREPAARAGRAQGTVEAGGLAAFWTGMPG